MLDTCTPNSTLASTHTPNVRGHLLEFVLEARSLYGGEAFVLSLLNLGSGHFGITHIMLPNNDTIANNMVLEILPNSEVLAKRMERRMKDIGVYFRFSIEHGMQKNEPSYDDDPVSIDALALSYLDDEEVRNTAACYVESFVDRPGWINLDTLGTPVILQINKADLNRSQCEQFEFKLLEIRTRVSRLRVTCTTFYVRLSQTTKASPSL
jgi:hypothetical protein